MRPAELNLTTQVAGYGRFLFVRLPPGTVHPAAMHTLHHHSGTLRRPWRTARDKYTPDSGAAGSRSDGATTRGQPGMVRRISACQAVRWR